jgi:hypothetical protein
MNADLDRRAGRREWIGLAVLALACLLYSMDLTVLHLAVPALSADLRPSGAQLLWIIDVYGFFVAGSLITMGTWATVSAAGGCCSSAQPCSVSARCWRRSRPAPSC